MDTHLYTYFYLPAFEWDELTISVNLKLPEVNLQDLSPNMLKTLIAGISLFVYCLDDSLPNEDSSSHISRLVIQAIRDFPHCPFSDFYLHALNVVTNMHELTKKDIISILCRLHFYLHQSDCHESELCTNSLPNYVIKNLQNNRKIRLFDTMNKYEYWDNDDCAILIHLINNWPMDVPLDTFLNKIARHIINVSTKHMTFHTWNLGFMKNVMINLKSKNDRKVFETVFSECVTKGISHFGSLVYKSARKDLIAYFTCITMFNSLKNGCIDILDYQEDLDTLVRSHDKCIQRFAFKILCTFHTNDAELTAWHIENVKYYLNNADLRSKPYLLNELNKFLQHMVVKANEVLKSNKIDKLKLEYFVKFSVWVYHFSMKHLLSDSKDRIKIGDQIFNLAQEIFEQNSICLTTNYELNENQHYEFKRSPFYRHLLKLNKFPYDKQLVFEKVLENFIVIKTPHHELITFLKKWYVANGPCQSIFIDLIASISQTYLDGGYSQAYTTKGIHISHLVPALEWNNELLEEDLNQQICNAKSILQAVTFVRFGDNLENSTILMISKHFLEVIRFLSKNCNVKTIDVLKTILEVPDDDLRFSLKFELAEINLVLLSPNILKTVVVAGISLLVHSFSDSLPKDNLSHITRLLIQALERFPYCAFSEHYLYALGSVIKIYKQTKKETNSILSCLHLYLNQSEFKESELFANNVANDVIKKLKNKRKIRLFDKINNLEHWDEGDCAILSHLINNWPMHIPLSSFLSKLAQRLTRMTLETWNSEFLMNQERYE
ncbi:hypothetical protein FQR65_LT00029 [Abscondita terminalis]|nr:hypothetical protein FQR65_LT00029 [Abscondita terminalis]